MGKWTESQGRNIRVSRHQTGQRGVTTHSQTVAQALPFLNSSSMASSLVSWKTKCTGWL